MSRPYKTQSLGAIVFFRALRASDVIPSTWKWFWELLAEGTPSYKKGYASHVLLEASLIFAVISERFNAKYPTDPPVALPVWLQFLERLRNLEQRYIDLEI